MSRKGKQNLPKTPGDFPLFWHQVILQAIIGQEVLLKEVWSDKEALATQRHFRDLVVCLRKFPLHRTSRELAERPAQAFATRTARMSDGFRLIYVKGIADTHKILDEFLTNLNK